MAETSVEGPAPATRGRRLDARRNLEGIVVAAAELLARAPRASMQDVAAAAGLHRATVHRHFPARDDLLAAVRDHAFAVAEAQMDADARVGTGEPAIRVVERIVGGQIEVNDRYRITRYIPMVEGKREVDRPDRLRPLTDAVARAQADGALRDDLPAGELAIAIAGLIVSTLPELYQGRMSHADATTFCLALVRATR